MGPDAMRLRVDRNRLICTFWSLCVPDGEERAIVTKHVLVNETYTHISKEVGSACEELGAAVADVLRHLQKLLTAVHNATRRLSTFMGRCEGAFEGIIVDGGKELPLAFDEVSSISWQVPVDVNEPRPFTGRSSSASTILSHSQKATRRCWLWKE